MKKIQAALFIFFGPLFNFFPISAWVVYKKKSVYDVILVPKYSKITRFWPFSPIMTYFDQIDPINDTFDQIYVHNNIVNGVSFDEFG